MEDNVLHLLELSSITKGSGSIQEYEFAKDVLATQAYLRYGCEYDEFIKILVDYLKV